MDRLLCVNPDPESGYIINVDTKWRSHPDCHSPREEWHQTDITQLYCLGIVRQKVYYNVIIINNNNTIPVYVHLLIARNTKSTWHSLQFGNNPNSAFYYYVLRAFEYKIHIKVLDYIIRS